MTVEVDGRHVIMIGVEDLIVDRLCGYQYGKSTGDLHWATSLYASFVKRLDQVYLYERARMEKVEDVLRWAKTEGESIGHDAEDREVR